MTTIEERFWEKVSGGNVDECWMWTAYAGPDQYGRFNVSGKPVLAHRWAYEHLRADIPYDLDIDHLCRNRRCVNPWHLEPVTRSINLQRVPRPSHCTNGHLLSGSNIRMEGRARRCIACQRDRNRRWYSDPENRAKAIRKAAERKKRKREGS